MTIQNPLFQPPSEWVCPGAIDYKGQSPVAIDLETYDPGIKDHGPGWATGNGKVVGVALAWEGFKGYWPIDHDTPCLLYTSPSPRDGLLSRMPSSA